MTEQQQIIDTFITISDITGRQYPYCIDENGISIGGITVTATDYKLNEIHQMIKSVPTFIIENRIFRVEHVIEISFMTHPRGVL